VLLSVRLLVLAVRPSVGVTSFAALSSAASVLALPLGSAKPVASRVSSAVAKVLLPLLRLRLLRLPV
jgi:hypothetical protein